METNMLMAMAAVQKRIWWNRPMLMAMLKGLM